GRSSTARSTTPRTTDSTGRSRCSSSATRDRSLEVACLEVPAQVLGIEWRTTRALRELGGLEPAGLFPDVRAQPAEHTIEVTARDVGLERRLRAPQRREPLRRIHRAERVAREV